MYPKEGSQLKIPIGVKQIKQRSEVISVKLKKICSGENLGICRVHDPLKGLTIYLLPSVITCRNEGQGLPDVMNFQHKL